MRQHAAAWLWDGAALHRRVAVSVDSDGVVAAVSPLPPEAPAQGVLLPGLVNAHTHLELSWLAGAVPGGEGSAAWVRALGSARTTRQEAWAPRERQARTDQAAAAAALAAAQEARRLGTAFLVDVSNEGCTASALRAAGLRGVIQLERLGVDPSRWRGSLDAPRNDGALVVRTTAHSPISCSPALLRAALSDRPVACPAPTIHCDEDPADQALLADRSGPWADFHRFLAGVLPNHDWETGLGRGRSGVEVLHQAGVLGAHLGLVHLVAADDSDLDRVARAGATAVLCPRSNLHITGLLPNVPGMLERGIPLAIGTDSLASSPDLDLLAEAATLRRHFPSVALETWMTALTSGGGALLADPQAGRIQAGARPGLLRVDLPDTADPLAALLDGTPWPRTWLP